MSEENVELVRATFDETRRLGDPTPRTEYFDPEFEFHEDPRLPEARLYRGVEEVLAYWKQFIENFDEFVIEPGMRRPSLVLVLVDAESVPPGGPST